MAWVKHCIKAWSCSALSSICEPLDEVPAQLADVLMDCVEGGASDSFMWPLARERAIAYWQGLRQGIASGERALLMARITNLIGLT